MNTSSYRQKQQSSAIFDENIPVAIDGGQQPGKKIFTGNTNAMSRVLSGDYQHGDEYIKPKPKSLKPTYGYGQRKV